MRRNEGGVSGGNVGGEETLMAAMVEEACRWFHEHCPGPSRILLQATLIKEKPTTN